MKEILLALTISFLWGIQPILYKILLEQISYKIIMILSGFVYFLCLLIFLLVNYNDFRYEMRNITMSQINIIIFISIITIFFVNINYFSILMNNKSYVISGLVYSAPLFTFIVSYLLLNEDIVYSNIIGLFFITFGIILLTYNNS